MGEGFLELFQNIYEKFPQYTTYWGGNIAKRDYSILFRDVYIRYIEAVASVLRSRRCNSIHSQYGSVQVSDIHETFTAQVQ